MNKLFRMLSIVLIAILALSACTAAPAQPEEPVVGDEPLRIAIVTPATSTTSPFHKVFRMP